MRQIHMFRGSLFRVVELVYCQSSTHLTTSRPDKTFVSSYGSANNNNKKRSSPAPVLFVFTLQASILIPLKPNSEYG